MKIKMILFFLVIQFYCITHQLLIGQTDTVIPNTSLNSSINLFDNEGLKSGIWVDTIVVDMFELITYSNYSAGVLNGVSKTYYNTGILEGIMYFVNGEKEGIARFFYPDGTIKMIFLYEGGKTKMFLQFSESGKLFIESYGGSKYMYNNGRLFSPTKYIEDK